MQSPPELLKATKEAKRTNKPPLIPGLAPVGLITVMAVLVIACMRAGVQGLLVAGAIIGALAVVGGLVVIAVMLTRSICKLVTDHQAARPSASTPPQSPAPEEAAPAPAIDFWGSLTEAERLAVRAVAEERTFAMGAVLFHEGERADHVVVIRSGWTAISVEEGGRKHVLAERGPGQLVGERAALEVNVRSATVIALSPVHALVLRTEDFASFVGAHPRVLGLLNDQIYDRLTRDRFNQARTGMVSEGKPQAPWKRPVWHPTGEICTLVMTDIVGFGDRERWTEDRDTIRAIHFERVQAALTSGGIPWSEIYWEDRGDGLLLAISARGLTAMVLDALVLHLGPALARYNRRSAPPGRIQLRVAVHVGPVRCDGIGLTGEALIHTARLLDAPALRDGIAKSGACLGLLTSGFIYEEFIRNGASSLTPDSGAQIRIAVKEHEGMGWLRLSEGRLPPSGPAAVG